MESPTLLEATLVRTLRMASMAAENGEIFYSRHFGRQMREIFLEIQAVSLNFFQAKDNVVLPLRNHRVRKYFTKKIRGKGQKYDSSKKVFPELNMICQLFCPFCWVYLTATSTLGIATNSNNNQPSESDGGAMNRFNNATETDDNIPRSCVVQDTEKKELRFVYFCRACGLKLPEYQFTSGLSHE